MRYSAPLVDDIKKIANEQLEQQAKAESIEKAEAEQ